MRLRWRANRRRVVVTVEDRGIFRPGRPAPEEQRSIEPLMPGGYGLTLMSASTDELHLREGFEGSPGTRVQLVKRVPPPARRTRWTHLARAADPPVGLLRVGWSVAAGLMILTTLHRTGRNRRRDQKPQNGASASQGLQP